jgi:hypothetical protein
MRRELRIYRIRDGVWDDWVSEWHEHVLPLRRAHGFEVLGPWVAPAERRFVWMIGHDDLDAADAAYYASAERAAIEPDPARHVEATEHLRLEDG